MCRSNHIINNTQPNNKCSEPRVLDDAIAGPALGGSDDVQQTLDTQGVHIRLGAKSLGHPATSNTYANVA